MDGKALIGKTANIAHPSGNIEKIESFDPKEFEAIRRAHDREAARKRRKNESDPVMNKTVERDSAEVDASNIEAFKGPWTGPSKFEPVGPAEAELHIHQAQKEAQITKSETQKVILAGEETSIFHGASERDYLGRTYIYSPQDLDIQLNKEPGSFDCYAPKKLIHTWVGHTRGVTAIRFFPNSGHLLLSASQDSRIKLWDVHRDRQCLRTFLGHNKPVRDIAFDKTGHHFMSAAYDQNLKYWDTETGMCVLAIEHSAIPFCVKFHPMQPDIVLAGCQDRRIVQWDLRSGEIVQEYNQHLDAVNTITFLDEQGKRFVSTGDDKTIRVWDYDIPVTVKCIAEPGMHVMPAAALHPEGQQLVFQSLNNQIITYSCAGEKFQQRGRKFGGHVTSGFACNLGFSPDGKFLISGDGRGQLVVWDWKNGQIVRRIEAHSKVCIDVQWNPQETSRVATCSWDGTIKYWD